MYQRVRKDIWPVRRDSLVRIAPLRRDRLVLTADLGNLLPLLPLRNVENPVEDDRDLWAGLATPSRLARDNLDQAMSL